MNLPQSFGQRGIRFKVENLVNSVKLKRLATMKIGLKGRCVGTTPYQIWGRERVHTDVDYRRRGYLNCIITVGNKL